jgi:hypothetical protein
MSFYSGDNEFLKQIIPIFNVGDPAGGETALATVQAQANATNTMIDTINYNVLTNTITTFNNDTVAFNSPVQFNNGITGYITVNGVINEGVLVNSGGVRVNNNGIVVNGGILVNSGGIVVNEYVTVDGDITTTGDISTTGDITCRTLFQTSDKRLKTNITPIPDPLRTLQGIRGVHFTWKNNEEEDIGFLAQEVDKVLPIAVAKPTSVEGEAEATDDYWRVSYIKVVPVLVEAVKKLEDRIRELEGQMDVVYRYNRLSKG